MTVRQAALELNISEETIRRNIKDNVWPFFLLGGKSFRVDVDEIKALGKAAAQARKKRERPETGTGGSR